MSEPDWETDAADAVLRVLHQAGVAVPARVVATNLEAVVDDAPSVDAVAAALDELDAENYVRPFADTADYYVVTSRGEDYVANELEAEGFGFVD